MTWGPERTLLYNTAYSVVLGRKHPAAHGASIESKAFFSEEKKQKTFGPAVAKVLQRAPKGTRLLLLLFSKKQRLGCLSLCLVSGKLFDQVAQMADLV